MPDWIDFTPDLQDQALCTRLFCWPCHSSIALCNAVGNCDCCGVLKVMFCCPCRTCCAWCPTQAEQCRQGPDDEPEEIPYERVFEMEKKKREKMKEATIN